MRKAALVLMIPLAWISLVPALLSTTALATNSASFVKTDIATMGSWIGVYGANGYVVSQDGTIKNPSMPRSHFPAKPTGHGRLPQIIYPPCRSPSNRATALQDAGIPETTSRSMLT